MSSFRKTQVASDRAPLLAGLPLASRGESAARAGAGRARARRRDRAERGNQRRGGRAPALPRLAHDSRRRSRYRRHGRKRAPLAHLPHLPPSRRADLARSLARATGGCTRMSIKLGTEAPTFELLGVDG